MGRYWSGQSIRFNLPKGGANESYKRCPLLSFNRALVKQFKVYEFEIEDGYRSDKPSQVDIGRLHVATLLRKTPRQATRCLIHQIGVSHVNITSSPNWESARSHTGSCLKRIRLLLWKFRVIPIFTFNFKDL